MLLFSQVFPNSSASSVWEEKKNHLALMSVLTLRVLNDPPANGTAERQFAAAAPRPPPTPQPHPHQLRPSAVLHRSGRPSAAAPLSQSSLDWRRRSRAWRPGRKPSSPPWGRNWTPPVAAWLGTATTNWRYVHFFFFSS